MILYNKATGENEIILSSDDAIKVIRDNMGDDFADYLSIRVSEYTDDDYEAIYEDLESYNERIRILVDTILRAARSLEAINSKIFSRTKKKTVEKIADVISNMENPV